MRRLLLLVFLCGCSIDGLIANKLVDDQEKVRTYQGTFTERGTIPGEPDREVRGRVRFVAPSDFVLEVLSPQEYRGDTLAYLGSELWLYSAKHDLGIHIRGVPWSQERWRDWVLETVKLDRETFEYDEAPQPDTIAGRVGRSWYVKPREPGELRVSSLVWLDDEFSTVLRLETPGIYSFRFDEVAFNRPLERPTFEPPVDAGFLEWDMQANPVSYEDAKRYADFPILEPLEPLGFERTKIVWADTDIVPLMAFVYEKGPFYASVAECRDRNFRDPRARGIQVSLGDTVGRFATVAGATLLTFVRGEVQVTIVSNLPPFELVRFARSLR